MKKEAVAHGLELPAYLLETIRAYRDQSFVLPDKEAVRKLDMLLVRIGHNINQMAFQANREKKVSGLFDKMQEEVKGLRASVKKTLTMPPSLKEFALYQQKRDARFLEAMEKVIIALKKASDVN